MAVEASASGRMRKVKAGVVAPLRRFGSSRLWELVVRATAVRSRSMPGFPHEAASDGEVRTLTIDPVEETVATMLATHGRNDVARRRVTHAFAHAPLEAAYARYVENRYGACSARWGRRGLVVAAAVVACSVGFSHAWTRGVATVPLAAGAFLATVVPRLISRWWEVGRFAADCAVGWLVFGCVATAMWASGMDGEGEHGPLVAAGVTVVAAHALCGPPLLAAASVLVPSLLTGAVAAGHCFFSGDDDAWETWRIGVYFLLLNLFLLATAIEVDASERQRYLFIIRARAEQKRSMALLLRLLPETVLHRMRAGTRIESIVHPSASVMFVELHDFDANAHHAPHEVIIGLLNRIFGAFDEVVAKTAAFKVESVGPVYMVAANVLVTAHDHANVLLDIAKEFQTIAADRHMPSSTHASIPIQLRIGMHTGTVVSGVIASKLPRYRLFGDTVNTASRMCSTCAPGEIQLSSSSFGELCDYSHPDVRAHGRGDFTHEPRCLAVKGKGTMETHVLLRTAPAPTTTSASPTPTAQRLTSPLNVVVGSTMPVLTRTSSAMWGEACSPRVPLADAASFFARIETPSPPVSASVTPTPTPTPTTTPAIFPPITDALHCFAPPPSSVLGPLTRPLSEEELKLPVAAEEYHKAAGAAMHPLTLRFVRPAWLEAVYVDSTSRHLEGRALRSTVAAAAAFVIALAALTANATWGWCAMGRSPTAVTGAFAVVGASSAIVQRSGRRAVSRRVGPWVLGAIGLALSIILALSVPAPAPVLLQWCGVPLTTHAATYGAALVVVALGASGCMRVPALAGWVAVAVCFFLGFVPSAMSASSLLFVFAAAATVAHAHVTERHAREDFLAGVMVHVERRAYHDIGCHLLPRIVMEALCVPASATQEYSAHNADVAIMYADIVGFTALCAAMDHQTEVVALLKELYTAIDAVAEKHHVCKLETIGDAYWAAANLPAAAENDATGDVAINGIATFALALREIAGAFGRGGLEMRVGIAYGEVSTGVVGTISPRYHAFGPVVTAAQKMEKSSTAGKVLVTPEFSIRLQLARKRLALAPMYFYKAGGSDDRDSPLWMRDSPDAFCDGS